MGDFRVHHARFFEYTPNAVHCLSYDEKIRRLAVSRSDGSVEIWSGHHNWYQEKLIPPQTGHTVESLCWCSGRLFSAGLSGDLLEYDLVTLSVKNCLSSNSGAIWCLTTNSTEDHIAAGTEDGCVVLFDLTETGVQYSRALDRQEGRILSVAWHDPENVLVTGGVDNIRIWSLKSGHAIRRLTLARSQGDRETIVWALAVTGDFTIISGDSRGRTSFWNGKQGTLVRDFMSHKADVLCLAVNAAGTLVFAGGIDPTLIQFELTPINPNSDVRMWVKGQPRWQHTHDIRAVVQTHDSVISGGVDCQLIFNKLAPKDGVLTWKRYSAFPQQPLVYTAVAAHCVMLRYPDYLELWKLGSTTRTSEKSGEILPLNSNAIKLLQLKSKDEEHIVCAGISSDAQWLAYSDVNTVRLFNLTLEDLQSACPQINITRVRYLPPTLQPARLLSFTPDGSRLVLATSQGNLQVVALDGGHPTITCTFDISPANPGTVHLLTISASGLHVATATTTNMVSVFDIKKRKHVCDLPKHDKLATALTFHPSSPEMLVVYADMKIMEYNFHTKQYTQWSRRLNKKYHHLWLKRHSKVNQVMYNPNNPQQIFLKDELMFCIIDKSQVNLSEETSLLPAKSGLSRQVASRDRFKTIVKVILESDKAVFYDKSVSHDSGLSRQRFPDSSDNLYHTKSDPLGSGKKQEKTRHAFHICAKYKYLMHLDILEDDYLLVVERPPLAIMETFPPTLKQKKFGAS